MSTASLATVTTEACSKEEYAWAATRSTGVPALPSRASSRPTVSTVTPSGASIATFTPPPFATAVPSCSPRSRSSGVKRHSSSRPCGTGKSATSKEGGALVRVATVDSAATAMEPAVVEPTGASEPEPRPS
ncbi:hypothetical protein SMICM17S_00391 [Streptomyces microflavus]